MTCQEFDFAIFIENCVLNDSTNGDAVRTALLGQLVKVIGTAGEDRNVAVKFLKAEETWEPVIFYCKKHQILPVKEKLWPFLNAVTSPQERVKFVKNIKRCDRVLNLSKDQLVGFSDSSDIRLGIIKYIGVVKGIGKCFGIQLTEKKDRNKCDGSCAGIQYFSCLPGYGVFTTIDKIQPIHSPPTEETKNKTDLNNCLDKNVTSILINCNGNDEKPNHEEIVTKYNEYSVKPSMAPTKHSSYVRNSQSLQNILDLDNKTTNSNNDFDNSTVIPPDKTYLMYDDKSGSKCRNKSEMDLIDIIGSWRGTTDPLQFDSYSHLKLNNNNTKDKNNLEVLKHSRNKSVSSIFTHTLPKKGRILSDISDKKVPTPNKKINEKSEALAKACTSKSSDKPKYTEPQKGTTNDLSIGSLVEVSNDVTPLPLYGVIRWMGIESGTNFILVGVELEEEQPTDLPLTLTDGNHNGDKLFKCAENRAIFVPIKQCHKDSRFQDGIPTPVHQPTEKIFPEDCPIIKGFIAPLCMPTEEDVQAVCGKFRGIQGHHNSCYLDVTLFAMFTYTAVFDSLLFRPKGPNDIEGYDEVQRVLREEIVNPLRKMLYVSAGHVMNLRKLLDRLSSVSGLTSEEKDPEEFLNSLLAQILKAEPFLKLNSGQEAFYYQLFVEKDADLTLPTVQQLFEQSFLTSNIKLKEVPSCLIVQMPRFGKNYKMYPRILPSQLLDVTDIIEGSPRQCTVCGKLARYECKECFDGCNNTGLESTAFCAGCLKTPHLHERRAHHKPTKLEISQDYLIMQEHCDPPRLFMELFAVICIETSHYVTFVKCGIGHEAPWCFFDSMADRKGERNGYNIPEMVACPDISRWLSDDTICRQLHEEFPNDRYLPEHARRLLCDAYICMYQSSDVMMYR